MSAPIIDQRWRASALCAQVDPELFFPEKGGSTREAKAVCERCPVQAECLQTALDLDERYGIFGGMSERQRRALKNGVPVKLPPPPQDDPSGHGYRQYRRGCRCEVCRRGNAEFQRRYQKAHRVRFCDMCAEELPTGRFRYCSDECRNKAHNRHQQELLACQVCGAAFDGRTDARYCSDRCIKRAYRARKARQTA